MANVDRVTPSRTSGYQLYSPSRPSVKPPVSWSDTCTVSTHRGAQTTWLSHRGLARGARALYSYRDDNGVGVRVGKLLHIVRDLVVHQNLVEVRAGVVVVRRVICQVQGFTSTTSGSALPGCPPDIRGCWSVRTDAAALDQDEKARRVAARHRIAQDGERCAADGTRTGTDMLTSRTAREPGLQVPLLRVLFWAICKSVGSAVAV